MLLRTRKGKGEERREEAEDECCLKLVRGPCHTSTNVRHLVIAVFHTFSRKICTTGSRFQPSINRLITKMLINQFSFSRLFKFTAFSF